MECARITIGPDDRPTEAQLEELRSSRGYEIQFDEDSPMLTDEMLSRFRRVGKKGVPAAQPK